MKTNISILPLLLLTGILPAVAEDRNDALRQGAEIYATTNNVSLAVAEQRLKIQDELGDTVTSLRTEFKGRIAGIFLDHQPEQRIVVRLTGPGKTKRRLLQFPSGGLPIHFVFNASATKENIQHRIDENISFIRGAIPSFDGIALDERTGNVVIAVKADPIETPAYSEQAADISKLIGAPIVFDVHNGYSGPTAYVRGGAKADGYDGLCMTGFTVVNTVTNIKGVITAAHCDDDIIYGNYGYPGLTSIPLTFQDELYDQTHDVQWHTFPSIHTALGEIYASSTSDYSAMIIDSSI